PARSPEAACRWRRRGGTASARNGRRRRGKSGRRAPDQTAFREYRTVAAQAIGGDRGRSTAAAVEPSTVSAVAREPADCNVGPVGGHYGHVSDGVEHFERVF